MDDAAGWHVFLGIPHFPHPCIPALIHSDLISPSSAIKTMLLRAAQISQLNFAPAANGSKIRRRVGSRTWRATPDVALPRITVSFQLSATRTSVAVRHHSRPLPLAIEILVRREVSQDGGGEDGAGLECNDKEIGSSPRKPTGNRTRSYDHPIFAKRTPVKFYFNTLNVISTFAIGLFHLLHVSGASPRIRDIQYRACSPPTKAIRVEFNPRPGHSGFSRVGIVPPLVGGFSRGSPVSPARSFRRCSILTSITLIGSQDHDSSPTAAVKSIRPSFIVQGRRHGSAVATRITMEGGGGHAITKYKGRGKRASDMPSFFSLQPHPYANAEGSYPSHVADGDPQRGSRECRLAVTSRAQGPTIDSCGRLAASDARCPPLRSRLLRYAVTLESVTAVHSCLRAPPRGSAVYRGETLQGIRTWAQVACAPNLPHFGYFRGVSCTFSKTVVWAEVICAPKLRGEILYVLKEICVQHKRMCHIAEGRGGEGVTPGSIWLRMEAPCFLGLQVKPGQRFQRRKTKVRFPTAERAEETSGVGVNQR
ncbi:hypothetical protein PR048_014145 [Dryococelus australis]|uniref:Uncharacterized protein n=1 Tax=Dryococelus australis TaxID=614101 RepID=A0ABQ9HDF7_9NEOP|nr:hypothetical protein PR048_014145 [Dryococelus australis]